MSLGANGGGNSSLSRYSSLTTPFYQASPVTRGHQQQQTLKGTSNLMPRKGSSPHETGIAQSPDSIPTLISRPSPSSSVPFGKLIKYSSNSPKSSVTTNYGSNPPTSLFSTPPSSVTSPSAGYVGAGSKCAISRRNSGAKLSTLAEEKGHPNNYSSRADKKDNSTEKINSGGFDIITKSCLLDSEEEIENISATDDDNFPAGLNMSFTEFEEEDPGSEGVVGVGPQGQPIHHTGRPSSGVQQVPLPLPPAEPPAPPSGFRRGRPSSSGGVPIKPRRAASFSYGCELRENSSSECKASSLTCRGEDLRHLGLSGNPTFPPHQVDEEIVSMTIPFAPAAPSAQSRSTLSPKLSSKTKARSTDAYKRPSYPSYLGGSGSGPALYGGGLLKSDRDTSVRLGSLSVAEVRDSLELAEELQAMAKARQGPILLMSTSTSLVSE